MIDLLINLFNGFLAFIGAITLLICAIAWRDHVRCKIYELENNRNA